MNFNVYCSQSLRTARPNYTEVQIHSDNVLLRFSVGGHVLILIIIILTQQYYFLFLYFESLIVRSVFSTVFLKLFLSMSLITVCVYVLVRIIEPSLGIQRILVSKLLVLPKPMTF